MRLTKLESCYVAALIDGLRLIDDKARESGREIGDDAWNALTDYVQAKGSQIAAANGITFTKLRRMSEEQCEMRRLYSRRHYRENKARYAEMSYRYRRRNAVLIRDLRRLYYQTHLPLMKERRKRSYWKNPERNRALSREYHRTHRAIVIPKMARYRERHRAVLSAKQRERYERIKHTPKFKTWLRNYSERNRAQRRNYKRSMVALLPEGYIRSKLAYQHKRPSTSFTKEEVGIKRAQILRHRAARLQEAA